ncbi:hypothetical protein [Zhihengliuella flava]|uniref:Uncharacterized protein n=1 Tax=Zhihengliuella flava TaxID=1285193 RepID=A0A931D9E4_9MICC|nr:hypothetical protein [Zhihengliuella flava]MBG6083261.1 hypothetical protein [Zhihengliuella flava]
MTHRHITPELVETIARRPYDTGKASVPWDVIPDATKHGLQKIVLAFLNDAVPAMTAAGWTPPTTHGDELWAGVEKLHAQQTEQALPDTTTPYPAPSPRPSSTWEPTMPEKYALTTDDVREGWAANEANPEVWALANLDAPSIGEAREMFDHWLAKVKADALREAAKVIESEAAEQWRQDAGAVPLPGAQLIAQRMDTMARVLRERADKLEADHE